MKNEAKSIIGYHIRILFLSIMKQRKCYFRFHGHTELPPDEEARTSNLYPFTNYSIAHKAIIIKKEKHRRCYHSRYATAVPSKCRD